MVGKMQVNLVLLMTAVSVVVSCLVTNCPRGGKRGKVDFRPAPNDAVTSGLKKCELCSPRQENCFGIHCSWKISCEDEGHCISREVCCSKRLCKLQKSCEKYFNLRGPEEFQLSSLLLTKILRYNL